MDLSTPLQFVKGIGPARAAVLQAKGLSTVSDLLFYVPYRYEDRRNAKAIRELAPGEKAVVLARVSKARLSRFRGRGQSLFEVVFEDGSGAFLHARWFHGERYADTLVPGRRVALFGKVELETSPAARGSGDRVMVQPEIEVMPEEGEDADERIHTAGIIGIYEAAGKISTRAFRGLLHRVLDDVQLPSDPLPESVRVRRNLPSVADALQNVHCPGADDDLRLLNEFRTPAQHRLIFEEFFWLECGLSLKKNKARLARGIEFQLTEKVREQIKRLLPFKPTGAQRRALGEIANDMKLPHPMNRLLQGDVGSGKTMVAAQAAVIAIENGRQVAVLAPTELLAQQHFATFKKLTAPLDYTVVQLTGAMAAREKSQVKKLLDAGHIQLVVGTHALLQEDVSFARLGLAIIDEQHRFGVRQRWELLQKGRAEPPDVLVMTATPIPRTLALTLYGDLDVSIIDEMPPGRRPIMTRHVPESRVEQIYSFVAQEIGAGRQAYVVYPVVEETEASALKAAEQMHAELSTRVFPNLRVGLLHGRLPSEQKEQVMAAFVAGEIKILVSTTVIEVGVDVPNASVMVIEQAERFGLAQLHQLRGRVGRGPHQSYCILVTGKMNQVAQERIRTLTDSSDGFYIAEMDMKLRGPGEFFGTKQSGIPGLRLADLQRDSDILEEAREEADALLARPESEGEVRDVVNYLKENWQRRYGLVEVG